MWKISEKLHRRFMLPEVRGIDLDAPEAVGIHRQIIRNNPFLYRLYVDFYHFFIEEAKAVSSLPGVLLELGSGGGFLKEMMPEVVTSEVCAAPLVDRLASANRLPYPAGGLKAIFMLNVLHHLPDPRAFFREAERSLTPGGRLVMVEPFNSFFGRKMYQTFHHEPFDEAAAVWEQPAGGRMSTSNQAIPWIIFWRDRKRFEQEFPLLRVMQLQAHTPLRYVLSGGMSHGAFAPAGSFAFFSAVDRLLSRLVSIFPMFQTIVLEKQDPAGKPLRINPSPHDTSARA